MAAIAVEPVSKAVDNVNRYNSSSSKRKKQRYFSLRVPGLTRPRSNSISENVKEDNDKVEHRYATLASSKIFSQSQPFLLIDTQDKLEESNVKYDSDNTSSSSFSASLSRFRRRWSSLGRKSKPSSTNDRWWQEFEREVDPKILETDKSFTSDTNEVSSLYNNLE
jgi:hypothetical protein